MQIGDHFTQEFTVSKEIYSGFIDTFNDKNPLHTDKLFAKSKGFNDIVMHGNILNGFISYFIGECLPDKNVVIQTQSIQYSFPVYLNEILKLHLVIADVIESVNTVEFKFFFENSMGKKIAKGKIQIGILI